MTALGSLTTPEQQPEYSMMVGTYEPEIMDDDRMLSDPNASPRRICAGKIREDGQELPEPLTQGITKKITAQICAGIMNCVRLSEVKDHHR
jgi:hypothetical protein